MEGTPTDPADVPNQRTASEKAAAERAASLRAVFASSPRPGHAPDVPTRKPGETTSARPVGARPGNPPAGARSVGGAPAPAPAPAPARSKRRRRLWLIPAFVVLLAIAGGAAFVATRGNPLDRHDRTATIHQDQDATSAPPPATIGEIVPSAEPGTTPSDLAATSIAPTTPSEGPSASLSPSVPPAIGKPNSANANLALRHKVQSSSDEGPGYSAKAAVDGDATTRWSSGFADPQWYWVDLAGVWIVTDVRLNWEHAYAIKYRVDLSVDNKHWTTVYRTTTGTDGPRDIPLDPTPARYVRMYGTQRNSQYGYSLLEFEVR
ncbi:discoidin domain-containing protein [Paractinoplanes globisporus]|uniref:Discoidin domain-containing protein n=1 Tax=Paractinoplanes globisporus TaxID=113565 RepID=A0ABW6WBU9_9ACTN|nr:discoidin domain-containing protein [Actinoplanes globisporus]